jgi:hypothetical protein
MGLSFLWPRWPDPMHRMGVGFFFASWGVFLQSLTEWVYRQTGILFTFNIILGALASLYWLKRHGKRGMEERDAFGDHEESAPPQFGDLASEGE